MTEKQVELSSEEREYLVEFLRSAMRETLVEEHRTHIREYREHIRARERVIHGLLEKLEAVQAPVIPAGTDLLG